VLLQEGEGAERVRAELFDLLANGFDERGPALPERVVFHDAALHDALAPELRGRFVSCSLDPETADIADALERFLKRWARIVEEVEDDIDAGAYDDPIETEEDWDQIEDELTAQLLGSSQKFGEKHDKAWQRFLGVDRQGRDELLDLFGSWLTFSYFDWFALRHRSTPKSRTLAERLFEELEYDEAAQSALKARIDAEDSFHVVDAIDSDDRVDLVDVMTGERHTVRSQALCRDEVLGKVVVGKVYPVGPTWRLRPALPPFDESLLDEARAVVSDELGVRLETPIPRDKAHVVGRLWGWLEEVGDSLPSPGSMPG
jgi:hypothetical protein